MHAEDSSYRNPTLACFLPDGKLQFMGTEQPSWAHGFRMLMVLLPDKLWSSCKGLNQCLDDLQSLLHVLFRIKLQVKQQGDS